MSDSLAAELLADFDDDDNEEFLEEGGGGETKNNGLNGNQNEGGLSFGMEIDDADEDEDGGDGDDDMKDIDGDVKGDLEDEEDEETRRAKVEKMQLGGVQDVRSVAGLVKVLEPILEKIKFYQSQPTPPQSIGNIEDNPEYKLLVQSNAYSVEIDNEIILVHKFIRDHYSARFPELENLVTNPLDYAKTVSILGNDMDVKKVEERSGNKLHQVLDGPTMMIVTVEATTTKGQSLSEKELAIVQRACEMTFNLDAAKKVMTEYVQSRMNLFAPNTSALIGSQTAAQLINSAGGLTGLAKTPACNLAALGAKRQTQTGFATNIGIRQQGYLYHSPIIKNIPSDLKKQALRIVSAKVVLAARIDRVHEHPSGSMGEELKQQCLTRLEKLTEPPPSKGSRPLPAPDDKPSRKRGGRQARKAKQAVAMTEIRKAQNRMAFGKEEADTGYGTSDSSVGLGMIGQESMGRIRALQVDQRTRAKLGKNRPGWGGGSGTATNINGTSSILRGYGSSGNATSLANKGLIGQGVGGTVSSLAFTPVQGIELVDPKAVAERKRKLAAEENKYFAGGTFTKVGTGTPAGLGSMGPPPAKRVNTGLGGMGPPPVPKK